jgi:hypothetical protein
MGSAGWISLFQARGVSLEAVCQGQQLSFAAQIQQWVCNAA